MPSSMLYYILQYVHAVASNIRELLAKRRKPVAPQSKRYFVSHLMKHMWMEQKIIVEMGCDNTVTRHDAGEDDPVSVISNIYHLSTYPLMHPVIAKYTTSNYLLVFQGIICLKHPNRNKFNFF